ncbi:NUDIX hydrolase [Candidatus Woesearchaeota archaeon]|nr:NUDIX hydrolase [Candidatus Woesearchaeota archaeon]
MQKNILDIINEQDIVIGQATEEEVREKNLLHHSVHLLIVDSHNCLFCAHRITGRPIYSGWWTIPGAHVRSGETYEKTVVRFLKELKIHASFKQLHKIRVDDGFENEWSMLYLLKFDTTPFLAPEKFQEGKFLSLSRIRTLSQKEKVTPYLLAALEFVSQE